MQLSFPVMLYILFDRMKYIGKDTILCVTRLSVGLFKDRHRSVFRWEGRDLHAKTTRTSICMHCMIQGVTLCVVQLIEIQFKALLYGTVGSVRFYQKIKLSNQ